MGGQQFPPAAVLNFASRYGGLSIYAYSVQQRGVAHATGGLVGGICTEGASLMLSHSSK